MSTKDIIIFNKDFSLYKELFDEENIFLSFENSEIEYISTRNYNKITLKIPIELFKLIISEYEKNKNLIEEEQKSIGPKFIDLFNLNN